MEEKTKTAWDYSPELAILFEQEGFNRPKVEGLAIDSLGTHHPEDAIAAYRQKDGSFIFTASIVEAGLLDRRGESVIELVDQLKRGDVPNLDKLPREVKNFSFAYDQDVPALSVIGSFDRKKGLADVDLVRTKLNPPRFSYESQRDTENNVDMYLEARTFAEQFARRELGQKTVISPIQPETTIAVFANALNLSVARLTEEAKLPQLLQKYPVMTVRDGVSTEISQVSAEMSGHGHFRDKNYTRVTAPCRDVQNWVNQVSLTHFMDTGDSLLSFSDANLIAEWINERNAQSEPNIMRKALKSIVRFDAA
jgi:hypothetical protein